jgi:hypothetical protein
MNVYLCHGFNSRHHLRWQWRLASYLEAAGAAVVPVDYGWKHLVRIRRTTEQTARRIAETAQAPCAGIGHSNGCAVLLRAVEMGADFRRLVFINPALRKDVAIPSGVERVWVLHAENDRAVLAGYAWRRYNPLRLVGWSSPWGVMGRTGYRGEDARAVNVPLGPIGHSGFARWDRLAEWGPRIAHMLMADA